MNRLCAAQGRASANEWADKVKACFARDSLLTHYFHRQLADGKWNHMMSQTHIEGYAERNGLISIKPEKGYSATNSEGAVWKEIPGFGRTGAGMKAFPPTLSIPPDKLSAASPRLSYSFFLEEAGSFDIGLFLAPTIDFYNKGGLLTAISIDDGPPRILNIHDADIAYNWPQAVSGNVNVVRTRMDIPAGRHKLHLWHVDPGPAFEKVLIKRAGAEDETYLGPPASYVD